MSYALTIVANNRKAALDQREAEIEEKSKQLATDQALRSDSALRRRENAVAAREEAASREADRLAAIRVEFEAKLAKLSDLADALNGAR